MKIDLGEALSEWNCLEEAEQHIRDGLKNNETWRNIMTDAFGLIALTRVLQAKGDYTGAIRSAAPGHKLYAQNILNAFSRMSLASSPDHPPAGLVEPLSGRELEVLQLMSLGRTNQEIAGQLIVSPGTVKAHTVQHLPQAGHRQPDRGGGPRQAARAPPLDSHHNRAGKQVYE